MGEAYITRRGGGANLNFRVLGGTSAPATPRENDIWIPTVQPITDWVIGPNEPAVKTAGLVHIHTVGTSPIHMNLIRGKRIEANFGLATQYKADGTGTGFTPKFNINGLWKNTIDPIMSKNSWDIIKEISESGEALKYWSIGDSKDITLTTGEVLTLQIYGFNHDDLADGSGKAGITFGLKYTMNLRRSMNSSATNVGGFTGSGMYSELQGPIYNSLPMDLRPLTKKINKKTSAGGSSATIVTDQMKLFLFSQVECCGTAIYSYPGEGSKYAIFTDQASRIRGKRGGDADWWWNRSPGKNINNFCDVGSVGELNAPHSSNAAAICFGFCL